MGWLLWGGLNAVWAMAAFGFAGLSFRNGDRFGRRFGAVLAAAGAIFAADAVFAFGFV